MKHHTHLRHWMSRALHPLLLLLPLVAASCDRPDPYPPNQWWFAYGNGQPATVTRDGVAWLPRKAADGRWCYYPQQLCAFFDHTKNGQWGKIDAATLWVNGRRWALSPNADGTWSTVPPWEETTGEKDAGSARNWVCFLFALVIVIGVLVAVGAYGAGQDKGQGEGREAIRAELTAAVSERERKAGQRESEFEKARADFSHWCDKTRKEMERELNQGRAALRDRAGELDQQQERQLAAVRNAEIMLRTPPDAVGPAAIAQYLRKQHVQGAIIGDLITAKFLADRSGFVRLAWMVHNERPQPPLVTILRDGEVIRTDTGLAGEHGDHVVPGRGYQYAFQLTGDRNTLLGRSVQFELMLPTAGVWDADSGSDEEKRFKKIRAEFMSRFNGLKVAEELKLQCYADVKARGYPPEVESWLLSRIDALGQELSGDEL